MIKCLINSFRTLSYEFKDSSGNILPYRIFKPKIEDNNKYPLVLYLHGVASRGNNNLNQLDQVISYLTSNNVQLKFPSYILAPQCPSGKQWLNTSFLKTPFDHYSQKKIAESEEMKMIIKLIIHLLSYLPIDEKRIYVIGYSMGSSGTWDIISRYPDLFSAAVPISGVSDLLTARKVSHIPIWVFHGEKDKTAPVKLNIEMQFAIKQFMGLCKLTIFPNTSHNCLTKAINYPGLLHWLFSQRKMN